MMELFEATALITSAEHERIGAHYRHAVPWLERQLGGTPIISVTYPSGLGNAAVYHKTFDAIPTTIATVEVTTSSGPHEYVRLSAHNLTWLCAAHVAVEFHTWSPTLDDPQRAAFGRLTLVPNGTVAEDAIVAAARSLRDRLATEKLDAIVVLDGFRGLTLWIPFHDAPGYDRLALWLHDFAANAAIADPTALTVAPLRADRGDRVYLGTKSNHPGMGTIIPYAVRGTPALEVALPVAWDDLDRIHNGDVTAASFAEYVRLFGDVFARERARIGAQAFGNRTSSHTPTRTFAVADDAATPRNYIIVAARAILADGSAHGVDEILALGIARGLLPNSTTRKYVYTALHEYVVRTLGRGGVPEFVQVGNEGIFRLNEPVDAWPAFDVQPPPRWLAADTITMLVTRLRETSDADPSAFEIAVCDAFAALGFSATHIGGEGKPDGLLIAPLGTAGYRIVLECKTARAGGIVNNPRPEEPAKFRDAFDASRALLVGPAFGGDASLDDELRVHGVALWTVDDLITSLTEQIGPDELRNAFEPGRARAAIDSLVWERAHGRRKRIAIIADRLARAMWQTQTTLAASVALPDTPTLTEETLLVLVDESLAAENVISGISLDDSRAAIEVLLATERLRREGTGYIAVRPAISPTP